MSELLDGVLDDVRYVEAVLTQDEIDFLYNSGDGTSESLTEAGGSGFKSPGGGVSVGGVLMF